jgi:hypothetical protein
MTERDEIGGALGRADARQACRHEGVSLRTAGIQQLRQDVRTHADKGTGDRTAGRDRLVAHVDHARGALVVEVARSHGAVGRIGSSMIAS